MSGILSQPMVACDLLDDRFDGPKWIDLVFIQPHCCRCVHAARQFGATLDDAFWKEAVAPCPDLSPRLEIPDLIIFDNAARDEEFLRELTEAMITPLDPDVPIPRHPWE